RSPDRLPRYSRRSGPGPAPCPSGSPRSADCRSSPTQLSPAGCVWPWARSCRPPRPLARRLPFVLAADRAVISDAGAVAIRVREITGQVDGEITPTVGVVDRLGIGEARAVWLEAVGIVEMVVGIDLVMRQLVDDRLGTEPELTAVALEAREGAFEID